MIDVVTPGNGWGRWRLTAKDREAIRSRCKRWAADHMVGEGCAQYVADMPALLADLEAAEQRERELRVAGHLLVVELGDGILEEMREVWKHTQVACIKLRRDELHALLAPQPAEPCQHPRWHRLTGNDKPYCPDCPGYIEEPPEGGQS